MRWIQGENHPQRIWHPGRRSEVLTSQVSCSFPRLRRWVKVFSPWQVTAGEALLRISKRGPGLWVWSEVRAWWWLTAMAKMPEAHRACIHVVPGSQPLTLSRGHCFSGGPHRGPGVSWVTLFSPRYVRSPLSSVTLSLRINLAFTHLLTILRHCRESHVLLGHPISSSAPLDPLASWNCPMSTPHLPCLASFPIPSLAAHCPISYPEDLASTGARGDTTLFHRPRVRCTHPYTSLATVPSTMSAGRTRSCPEAWLHCPMCPAWITRLLATSQVTTWLSYKASVPVSTLVPTPPTPAAPPSSWWPWT